MRIQCGGAYDGILNAMFFQVSAESRDRLIQLTFAHEITKTFLKRIDERARLGLRTYLAHIRNRAHRYSSTFLTISRIWNGRPLTFEKATASIKYRARIIVQS